MNETLRIVIEIVTPILTFIGGILTKTFVDKRKNIKKNTTSIKVEGDKNIAVGGNYNVRNKDKK